MISNIQEKCLLFFHRYKSFGKELTINSTYRGMATVLTFVAGVIMSRDLMEANRGLFQLFVTSILFFNIFLNFGLNSSAQYYSKKSPEKMRQFVGLNIVVSLIGMILITFMLILFSEIIKFQSIELRNLFFISYFLFSVHMVFKSFLVGQDKNTYLQKIGFYSKLLFLIWIIILHYSNSTSVFLICLFLVLEYLAYIVLSSRELKIKIFPIQLDKALFSESLLFNIKSYLMAIFWISIMRGDQYFIKTLMGNYHVGLYGIGTTILENLGMINAMFIGMIVPRFVGESNYFKKLAQTKKGLLFVFLSSVFLASIIYFLSPLLIELYFKKTNIQASTSLQVLMIGFVFWSLFQVLNVVYLSERIKKTQLLILGGCTILSFTLNYFYIPQYGIVASAWISTLCYGILFFTSFFDLFYLKKKNWIKKIENE